LPAKAAEAERIGQRGADGGARQSGAQLLPKRVGQIGRATIALAGWGQQDGQLSSATAAAGAAGERRRTTARAGVRVHPADFRVAAQARLDLLHHAIGVAMSVAGGITTVRSTSL